MTICQVQVDFSQNGTFLLLLQHVGKHLICNAGTVVIFYITFGHAMNIGQAGHMSACSRWRHSNDNVWITPDTKRVRRMNRACSQWNQQNHPG